MSPDEYLDRSVEFCKDESDLHLIAGLAAEVGEVCALYQKSCYKGEDICPATLWDELGDVLWYFTQILVKNGWGHYGVFELLMKSNIEKLEKRHG